MKTKKYIIGNWKMYLDYNQSINLYKKFETIKNTKNVEVVMCPSVPVLGVINNNVKGLSIGVQDVSSNVEGKYTGEVSAKMVKQMKVKYAILGHVERRKYFAETNVIIKEKIKRCIENKIVPIICVGESFEERKQKKHFKVIKKQLKEMLNNISFQNKSKIIISYEPVWAIGSGDPLSVLETVEMSKFIKKVTAKVVEQDIKINVIYGGSVTSKNIKEFLNFSEIDGFLVGGSSVNYKEFCSIIKIMQSVN